MGMNGHHMEPQPDHTSILVGIASRLGRVEAKVDGLHITVSRLERGRKTLQDYSTPLIGAAILASAMAGKVTWSDALPSLLGLVAR
jgi:hypothetical protein